jgi:hypothetical protein
MQTAQIGVGRADVSAPPPSKTGQAVLPHPAFQSVGAPSRGSGSSPRPQVRRSDVRYLPSQLHSADSTTGEPSRALASVFFSVFLSRALPPSCIPSLHGRYPLHSYYGRSDSRRTGDRTLGPFCPPHPAGLPGFLVGTSRPFRLQPSVCRPGATRLSGDSAQRLSPALQASSFARRLAHPRRPNRVHGDSPLGPSVLRTGRSRSVALHPALLRRSYGSIPHGSAPHRGGLAPPNPNAIPGARARHLCRFGSNAVHSSE